MYPKWRSTQLEFEQGCSGTGETWFLFEHVCSPDAHVFGARTLIFKKFRDRLNTCGWSACPFLSR